MKHIAIFFLVLAVVGVFAAFHATWILILTNLLWMLVRGHVLVSWAWPICTGIYTVIALSLAILLKKKD